MTKNRLLTMLETLRKEMKGADSAREKSLSEVFYGFLNAMEHMALHRASKPASDEALIKIIEACARKVSGDQATVLQSLHIFRINAAGFWHGAFRAGAFMGSFFYFENDRQGILAFAGFAGTTHYTRITMTEILEGTTVFIPKPRGRWEVS